MATAGRQVCRAGRGRQLAECEPLALEKTDLTRVARSRVCPSLYILYIFLQVVNNFDDYVALELRLFLA